MIYLLVAILGFIVGSFLNAVIFRLKSQKSFINGRSECPHCHHILSAADLIPVFSFLYLKGKCRYCGKKISWQYPIVEALTAFLFLLSLSHLGLTISFIWSMVFISILIVIGIYDFRHFLILDKVILSASILAFIKNIALDLSAAHPVFDLRGYVIDGILAAIIISSFFAIQYYISKGKWIGFGDVKLGIFLGLLFGVKLGLLMLILGYFIGALTGITLIAMGLRNMSSRLPLGSFLAISAIIVLLYGKGIAAWYLNLIGF